MSYHAVGIVPKLNFKKVSAAVKAAQVKAGITPSLPSAAAEKAGQEAATTIIKTQSRWLWIGGGIGAVTLIAGGLLWWRRRRKRTATNPEGR